MQQIQYDKAMPYDPDPFKNFTPRQNPAKESAPEDDNSCPLTEDDLTNLETMPRNDLRAILLRVCSAGWGDEQIGETLLKTAVMSEEQVYDALMLKASALALTAKEVKDFVAASTQWLDRKRGKPVQSVDINQKIGIVAIVMEAAKQRKDQLIEGETKLLT